MSRRSAPERLSPQHAEAEAPGKYVGAFISLPFHAKLQERAKSEGMTLAAYIRESLLHFYYRNGQQEQTNAR